MADDTKQQGKRDRAQVAGGEGYEVSYFASKHGISRDEAQALIDRIGNDRAKLDAAASKGAASTTRTGGAAKSKVPKPTTSTKASTATSKSKAPARRSTSKTAKQPSAQDRRTAAKNPAPAARKPIDKAKSANRTASSAARKIAAVATSARKSAQNAGAAVKATATSKSAGVAGAAAVGIALGLAANIGRKLAVQAPSMATGDWLEALKVEHKLALGLLDKMMDTPSTAKAKRSTLLAQLKHALSKHAFTEENVIYPALRAWGDKADADKLNHDHAYVKQTLFELEGMKKDAPEFLVTMTALKADLSAHISEEETAILPRLHRELGDKRNAEITAMANKEGLKLA